MTTARKFPVFATTFAVVYAVAYVFALENNYAIFTYHPVLNEFALFVEEPKTGPAMYWYGWMVTAGIAAFAAGAIACIVPENLTKRLWSGWSWAVPVITMFAFGYLLRGFFMR